MPPEFEIVPVTLATPFDVVRLITDSDHYKFGWPPGLGPSLGLYPDPFVPAVQPPDYVHEGVTYITTLDDALDALLPDKEEIVLVRAAFYAYETARKIGKVASLVGYIPVKFKAIPYRSKMSYRPHARLVYIGHFGATATTEVERFSFSMSYDMVDRSQSPPATIGQDALDNIEAIAKTWWAVPENAITSEAWLESVAYARIMANGLVDGGQYERSSASVAVAGPGNVQKYPLQIASVVTLDGHGPRGGRFGRFFLPALGGSPLTLGSYPAANASGSLATVAAWLDSVNGALSTEWDQTAELVIASGRGTGENRPVRELRMGVVPDTMRSRRRSLAENYQALDFQT